MDAILDVFDKHVVSDARAVAAEIGGAPGQYLAYLHRRFGFRCIALDLSPHSCELTRMNLEHFVDVASLVAAHVRFVRPGGELILGVPNLLGVNHRFARQLAPRRLSAHYTQAMSLECLDVFEVVLGLKREFRGSVGGFEPDVFCVIEEQTPARMPIWVLARLVQRAVGTHFPTLRRFNHAKLSGYLMGVWRVPKHRRSEPGFVHVGG